MERHGRSETGRFRRMLPGDTQFLEKDDLEGSGMTGFSEETMSRFRRSLWKSRTTSHNCTEGASTFSKRTSYAELG